MWQRVRIQRLPPAPVIASRRLAPPETVILRHRVSPSASPMTGSSGVSSTPQLLDSITGASEYWIARRSLSSGGHSADPLAGDDGWVCGAFAFNELPPAPVIARSVATIAVGTLIAERPPHRTVRAAFPHTAPTLGG